MLRLLVFAAPSQSVTLRLASPPITAAQNPSAALLDQPPASQLPAPPAHPPKVSTCLALSTNHRAHCAPPSRASTQPTLHAPSPLPPTCATISSCLGCSLSSARPSLPPKPFSDRSSRPTGPFPVVAAPLSDRVQPLRLFCSQRGCPRSWCFFFRTTDHTR